MGTNRLFPLLNIQVKMLRIKVKRKVKETKFLFILRWYKSCTQNLISLFAANKLVGLSLSSCPMRLCQPPDGSTSPKYKLLHF
jgi:hypothetical protein